MQKLCQHKFFDNSLLFFVFCAPLCYSFLPMGLYGIAFYLTAYIIYQWWHQSKAIFGHPQQLQASLHKLHCLTTGDHFLAKVLNLSLLGVSLCDFWRPYAGFRVETELTFVYLFGFFWWCGKDFFKAYVKKLMIAFMVGVLIICVVCGVSIKQISFILLCGVLGWSLSRIHNKKIWTGLWILMIIPLLFMPLWFWYGDLNSSPVLGLILEHPWFGYGLGALQNSVFKDVMVPHVIMQIWFEWGLMGALWWCILCAYVLYKIYILPQQEKSFALSLFAVMIGMLIFGGVENLWSMPFWYSVILVGGLRQCCLRT